MLQPRFQFNLLVLTLQYAMAALVAQKIMGKLVSGPNQALVVLEEPLHEPLIDRSTTEDANCRPSLTLRAAVRLRMLV